MSLLFRDLNQLWGAPWPSDESCLELTVGNVCTDSRKLKEGDFFVPLIGENFDGHAFLGEALDRGALAAVVSKNCKHHVPSGLFHWIVKDTLQAYQQLASLHRGLFDIPVVAVTGSSGKTTTRELIRSALSSNGKVLASKGNENNDIGVPLTLLKTQSNHSSVVVEMGMRGEGEIERLSCCAKPSVAVITNVGTAHIGLLGSREAISKAKCEVTAGMDPSGLVIIPAGDLLLEQALSKTWNGRVVRIGIEEDVDIKKSHLDERQNEFSPKADLKGTLDLNKGLLEVEGMSFNLPLKGRHNAQNFMLALAVSRELCVPWSGLTRLELDMPTGRSQSILVGGITVMDETYNASPEAVVAALELLALQPGRRFAVLGKMMELGEQSISLHKKVAEKIVELEIDGLVLVLQGSEVEVMSEIVSGCVRKFAVVSEPEEAGVYMREWLSPGDAVLLKASRKVALEKLIKILQESF